MPSAGNSFIQVCSPGKIFKTFGLLWGSSGYWCSGGGRWLLEGGDGGVRGAMACSCLRAGFFRSRQKLKRKKNSNITRKSCVTGDFVL